MPELSRRAQSLGTENAFVVLAEVNELARGGKDIVSFCIGQPDFPAPLHVQDAAIRAIREGKHGYTPSAGIDPLREAAAKYLAGMRGGLPIRPTDVVIGAGAKPFIAYAILSVTDHGAGDEVIFPVPGFPIYESQVIANGAVPVPLFLREARDFAFDPGELEAKIGPRTRLLALENDSSVPFEVRTVAGVILRLVHVPSAADRSLLTSVIAGQKSGAVDKQSDGGDHARHKQPSLLAAIHRLSPLVARIVGAKPYPEYQTSRTSRNLPQPCSWPDC